MRPIPEGFCIAPWTHTFLSPQGERRLCCASREKASFVKQYIDQKESPANQEFAPLTLEDHWNSEFMRSVRNRMLAGEKVPECDVCSSQVLNLFTYRQYFMETLFPHLVQEAISSTDGNGFTSMRPRSFDYRFFNSCNFKCRTCGPQLSSAWEKEDRQSRKSGAFSDAEPWMSEENKARIKNFQENIAEKEFRQAIEEKRMEEIYWVGGEPLLWDLHWKYMSQLVENGSSGGVFVRYNTNLSKIESRGIHLFRDLLPKFKAYNVCASIDAAGKIGEYIRTGLDWEAWLVNFKEGVRYKNGDDSIVMDLTLTLPGLFGLRELLEIANELQVKMYVKLMFAFDPTKVLSPLALPRRILEPFIAKLVAEFQPITTWRTHALVETLAELPKRLTFEEQFGPRVLVGLRSGKQEIHRLASMRGDGLEGRLRIEDIFKARPEILDWWESL